MLNMCVLLSKKKIVKDHLPLKVVVVVQLETAKQDGIVVVVVIVNLIVTKIQAGSGELDSRL
jgi:hypothetical protein